MLVGLPMRPQMHSLGRRGRKYAANMFAVAAGSVAPFVAASAQVSVNPDLAAVARIPVVDSSSLRAVVGTLAGRSGKLLARFVAPPRALSVAPLAGSLNYSSRVIPGIQEVAGASSIGSFSLITMRSFRDKIAGSVGNYRIGFWPQEKGRAASEAYENPEGFIEVTRENQDTWVSDHFRLRDFLTKGQGNVWPKYLVLETKLVDKLELILAELEAMGHVIDSVRVMSGFRTPSYNESGGNRSGRAALSRHMYGDAADIYIDNDGNGNMDDLNGDGRVNIGDARVIEQAVERVERAHPALLGGTGIYPGTSAHGPFIHIDTRGFRTRWSGSGGN